MSIERMEPNSEAADSWLEDPELCFSVEDIVGTDDDLEARMEFVEEVLNREVRNVRRPEQIPEFARIKSKEA